MSRGPRWQVLRRRPVRLLPGDRSGVSELLCRHHGRAGPEPEEGVGDCVPGGLGGSAEPPGQANRHGQENPPRLKRKLAIFKVPHKRRANRINNLKSRGGKALGTQGFAQPETTAPASCVVTLLIRDYLGQVNMQLRRRVKLVGGGRSRDAVYCR